MRNDIIVSTSDIVCLVGGARIGNSDLSQISAFVNKFVAADSGADHLLAAGLQPDAVIGDLDSLSDHARATFAHLLCHISEQDTTDFEKALTRIDAPVVLALGFTGGRIDHMLAVLNVLARHPKKTALLVDGDDVSFLARPGHTRIAAPIGERIALMPLDETRVTATGLRWPLTEAMMHPTGLISSSNEVAEANVVVQSSGPLLITLPRKRLEVALKAVAPAE